MKTHGELVEENAWLGEFLKDGFEIAVDIVDNHPFRGEPWREDLQAWVDEVRKQYPGLGEGLDNHHVGVYTRDERGNGIQTAAQAGDQDPVQS